MNDGPSPWFVRHAGLVAEGARLLDVAAGTGRHARFFAARGAEVVAVDRDATALASLAGIPRVTTRVLDLEDERWPLAGERFDAVIVSRYLHRPRFDDLLALLEPAGTLLYETFAAGNERYGRPSNPAFLLEPGELLARVSAKLVVVAFEQGSTGQPPAAVIERLAAVGNGRVWPPPLAE